MSYNTTTRRSLILLGERRTTVFQRFMAKGIDLLVVVAVFMIGKAISPIIGGLLAAGTSVLLDAYGEGQSVGKRIMGLRVIDDQTGISCTLWGSLLRNLPFVLAFVLSFVPVVWAFALFVAVPIILLECYLILCIDAGVRLGDVMGNTLVVEYMEEERE